MPADVRTRLRTAFPVQIGEGGAFYEYGVEHRSQRVNRDCALANLAAKTTGGEVMGMGFLMGARREP